MADSDIPPEETMDFEPRYTPEQEEFRQEVKAWM